MPPSPERENYKRVPFAVRAADAHAGDLDAFAAKVNAIFDRDEIRLHKTADAYELRLREIAIHEFDEKITALADGDQTLARRLEARVKAIGSYGLRGKKRQFVNFDKERKVALRAAKAAQRGKHFYARDNAFSREANALPAALQNQIICGDSEAELKRLPGNCIDAVLTSPPYNFGLDYGNADDAIDWNAYFAKLFRVLDECVRVLKHGGRLMVNIQPLYSDYIPSHHIVSAHLMRQKMIWKGEILWEKNNYNCKYTSWGSWKSPSSPYLKYTWEFLEVFCKGALKKTGHSANADISAEAFKKWVTAKWSIAPERDMKKFNHPAMFPRQLAERALLLFTFKGDTVLDPFNGVGTTCVAAKARGRGYIGIDISKEYCATAEARIAAAATEPPAQTIAA